MKVYLKTHHRNEIDTVAICDENLLNKTFKEGNLKIEITELFFGGELMKIEKAISILQDAFYFNIVGECIVSEAVEKKLLPKEGVRKINGIPMAMKMMF